MHHFCAPASPLSFAPLLPPKPGPMSPTPDNPAASATDPSHINKVHPITCTLTPASAAASGVKHPHISATAPVTTTVLAEPPTSHFQAAVQARLHTVAPPSTSDGTLAGLTDTHPMTDYPGLSAPRLCDGTRQRVIPPTSSDVRIKPHGKHNSQHNNQRTGGLPTRPVPPPTSTTRILRLPQPNVPVGTSAHTSSSTGTPSVCHQRLPGQHR